MTLKVVFTVFVLIVCIIIYNFTKDKEHSLSAILTIGIISTVVGNFLIPSNISWYDIYQYTEKNKQNQNETNIDNKKRIVTNPKVEESTEEPTDSPTEEPTEAPTLTLSEKHTPNDTATNVYIQEWDSGSDIGIDGNIYEGGHKITISNTFNYLGSGLDNKVKSRIIIPLSKEYKQYDKTHRFKGTFVLVNDMYGSKSSGTIKILINNKKVFSTGKIDGNTTKAFPFDINYGNADSIVIQTNVTLNKGDFVYGFVDSKN